MARSYAMTAFSRGSTNRLTAHDLGRFAGPSLLAAVGRAVCEAGCLPRKELFETWEMARRVRRRFRGGRVVDLAAGHGLLAQLLLVLDDSSPTAVAVDPALASSAPRLHASLAAAWPRLRDRVEFKAIDLDGVRLSAGDLIVSCHACGGLTDRILDAAMEAGARVAVLPCCHDAAAAPASLSPWMDAALAVDVARVQRLERASYEVWTQLIPCDITPKNRLLMARPAAGAAPD
jgi:hypothetical protein